MSTTLHGVEQSGLSTKRPAKGHNGHGFWETDTLGIRVWNDEEAVWQPFEYIAFEWDVTGGDDGAIGEHVLNVPVPAGTIVLDGVIDVITTFASATDAATIAIHFNAANDLVSAVAISTGTPWDAGLHAIVPLGAAANAKKASADRNVTITVGTEEVTAGKLRGMLRCLRSAIA